METDRHSPAFFMVNSMLDYTHLEALLAVAKEGSFEGAGKSLGMTPIGVASRIRKLEERMGVKLLKRKPTEPTKAGAALCTYTSQIVEIEDELMAEQRANGLQSSGDSKRLKIAVTDDSLTYWIGHVLNTNQSNEDNPLLFDITLCDLDHTVDLMRNGSVIAGFTSSATPVHGFKSFRLGERWYRAVASPDFITQHFQRGVCAETISSAHCIRLSTQDSSNLQWLDQQFDTYPKVFCTRLPKHQLIIEMCLAGVGWAVLPEPKISEFLKNGQLVELVPDTPLVKTIYWHMAQAMSQNLAQITKIVKDGFHPSSG